MLANAASVFFNNKSIISINCSSFKLSKFTISSTLFRNSGLKISFNAFSVFPLSIVDLPNPIELVFVFDPAFEVIIIIVFSKLTVFPCASVSFPSSKI